MEGSSTKFERIWIGNWGLKTFIRNKNDIYYTAIRLPYNWDDARGSNNQQRIAVY